MSAKAVAIAGMGITAIGGTLYIAYKYFVEPGQMFLAEYRYILDDIYKETKEFLETNQNLETPIYGLTTQQQAIIEAKKERLKEIEPQVQKILDERQLNVNDWITEIIIGAVLVFVVPPVAKALINKLGNWRKTPKAQVMGTLDYATHLIFETISNEFAYSGNLNVASGFYAQIQQYYSSYTQASLVTRQVFYTSWLQTYAQGTWQYLIATQMLNFIAIEQTAIMGAMYSFWLPPVI